MPFEFEPAAIDGVVLVKPEVFGDDRGYLLETYDRGAFDAAGLGTDFILELLSRSKQGVLRGLHQQEEPFQQAKLVRCLSGEIFDVAVDVRPDSDTYGAYVSYNLSSNNRYGLYIPQGFLHGFVTLSEDALVHYKLDSEYAPAHERGVVWDDPDIDIDWPVENPVLTTKDQNWPRLRESAFATDTT